ncbi:hypothetical protein B0H11DRAFT_1913647 [Mycena galericulata]|nr:hypothetical protein B0H11DRAFT_1913647 [Mycena galericulata]
MLDNAWELEFGMREAWDLKRRRENPGWGGELELELQLVEALRLGASWVGAREAKAEDGRVFPPGPPQSVVAVREQLHSASSNSTSPRCNVFAPPVSPNGAPSSVSGFYLAWAHCFVFEAQNPPSPSLRAPGAARGGRAAAEQVHRAGHDVLPPPLACPGGIELVQAAHAPAGAAPGISFHGSIKAPLGITCHSRHPNSQILFKNSFSAIQKQVNSL